jgi:hypothetical protein
MMKNNQAQEQQVSIMEKLKLSTHQLNTFDIIQDIYSSCYVGPLNLIIFAAELKEEYCDKNLNKLWVFDTIQQKLVSKSLYSYI